MSTAYSSDSGAIELTDSDREKLCLPVNYLAKNSSAHDVDQSRFTLDTWNETDFEDLFRIFAKIVEDGQSYPQETIDREQFRRYFLSHYCFVVRIIGPTEGCGRVAAAFYVKPNFPGRSSHLANYGLIVHDDYRGLGLANFMVEHCIRLAKLLGFKALYTNWVYENNHASIKTCHRYGFSQVGRVPKAGRLKDIGYADALQFYREL